MFENHQLDYFEVSAALERAEVGCDAADCHGLFCGLILASGSADPRLWLAQLFERFNPKDVLQAQAFSLLQQLQEQTLAALNSEDLDFDLLLPDDETPLDERTRALASWCSGLLAGLGIGGLSDPDKFGEDVRELIDDFSQIARVDFDLEQPDEQESAAFMEVAEYIRVGVLFLYDELQPRQAASQTLQ